MIPKLSAPLIKDIRTGEGILEWILAILGVAAGATGNLSLSHTALYLTIIAAIKGVRRGLVKVVSLQQSAGIGTPLEPGVLQNVSAGIGTLLPEAESVLADISLSEAAAAKVQTAAGTPAKSVTQGLAPSPVTGSPGQAQS